MTINRITELQAVTADWRDHNFPPQQHSRPDISAAFEQLAGMMEEMGELSHALLKQVQKIRTGENLRDLEMDAIGDLMIYLCGYCDRRGLDLFDCINRAWNEVKDRDWIRYPETGKPPPAPGKRIPPDRPYTTGSEAPGFGGPITSGPSVPPERAG